MSNLPQKSDESSARPTINISGVQISPGKYVIRVTIAGLDFDSSVVSKETAFHMFGLVTRSLGVLDGTESKVPMDISTPG